METKSQEPVTNLDVTIITNTMKSIDASLKTIVNISYWWLFLSIAAALIYFTRYF